MASIVSAIRVRERAGRGGKKRQAAAGDFPLRKLVHALRSLLLLRAKCHCQLTVVDHPSISTYKTQFCARYNLQRSLVAHLANVKTLTLSFPFTPPRSPLVEKAGPLHRCLPSAQRLRQTCLLHKLHEVKSVRSSRGYLSRRPAQHTVTEYGQFQITNENV
jgi:hypothetical protein